MVEPDKKGPNGIWDLSPFLPNRIKHTPIIAPEKKDNNKAIKMPGQPRINPIKKANLTSPNPIHLPLEINIKLRKKTAGIKADKR